MSNNFNFFVYRNYVLVGALDNFISVKWIRRYQTSSEFSVVVNFDRNALGLLQVGSVIYKKDTKESMRIDSISIEKSKDLRQIITIKGKCFLNVFESRVVSYAGNKGITEVLSDIINQNIISPSNVNRKIDMFVIERMSLSNRVIKVEYENENMLEVLSDICVRNNIGMKVNYNRLLGKLGIIFYEGARGNVVFSNVYNNVWSQEYYKQVGLKKSTCLIDIKEVISIVGDQFAGFNRQEIYKKTTAKKTMTITEQGLLELEKYKDLESLDININPYDELFKYRMDYNLGDVVRCKDKLWNLDIMKNINEVVEIYDCDRLEIGVVLGDMY